jgi:replicative DNA helicase
VSDFTTVGDGALPPPPDEPPPADTSASANGRGRGFDRVPPHSLEAEVSVLGACLLSRSAAVEVSEFLEGEDFYRSAHRTVYEAIQDLMQRGEPVDPVTLLDLLAATDRLAEVGGAQAIHDLVSATPTAANAVHYGRIVRDRALLRRLIQAGTDIVQLGYDPTDDPIATVSEAESIMFAVADSGTTGEATALKDLLAESFRAIEELSEKGDDVTGLPTGFRDLDRMTAGFQPQNLIILAARPAMGKCLAYNQRVVDPSTGALRPIGEIVEEAKPASVVATAPHLRQVAVDVGEFHANGVRRTWSLRTRLGRSIRATSNHPFLTPAGWAELRELRPGDLVAVPRVLHVEGSDPLAPAEAGLLGYLIGDGCLRSKAVKLTAALPQVIEEAGQFAAAFGMAVTPVAKHGTDAVELHFISAHDRVVQADVAAPVDVPPTVVQRILAGGARPGDPVEAVEAAAAEVGHTGRAPENWLRRWLEELGLWGRGSHDKFVPDPIFRAPNEQVAIFLSRLYAPYGSAWVAKDHGYFGISYASVSERLVRDVQHLLLRFGIIARIRERQVAYTTPAGDETRRPAFELEIRDAENVLRFLDEIGIFAKDDACAAVRAAAEARGTRHTNTDLLPVEVWDLVIAAKGERSWADVSEATGRPRNHNWHVGRRRPSRRLVGELAEALDSDELRAWATSDVYWDEVVSIEEHGPEPVYDLTVPGLHNFVADDIVVHNSSLSLSIAQYVTAELQEPVAIFSLEMSKQEIVQRLLASEAMIDSSRLKTGRLEDHDWRKLGEALGKLADAPLFIDDTPSINLMEISSKCRRLKQRYGLRMIIVDYLQLMTSHRRVDNRQEEVSQISRGLKMLAKELNVPVIALSQLNRSPEARTDKRPMLADLRESGAVEQDADIVGFIYRDEVYNEDSPDRGIAELIIAKHRNGGTGIVKLAFLGHVTKFANLARGAGGPEGPPGAPPPTEPPPI